MSIILRGTLLGAGALLGLCAAAPEANAQYGYTLSRDLFDDDVPLIPPRAVAYRLQSRGFTDLSRPRFDGTAYVIDATSPAGTRVRLFVDAQDGAIIGRRPLDIPYYPSARDARPAPGYGWTEEDASRRRTARAAEGLIPPADIPDAAPSRPSRQAALGPDAAPRAAAPEANPLGLNPDGKARPAAPPKKAARLNAPQKPVSANAAPAAPAPRIEAAEKAKPDTAPEPKQGVEQGMAAEPSKAEAANAEPRPAAPAVDQEASERAAAEAIKAEKAKQDQGKQDQKQDTAWRDPTPEESKRKVRVIDGATLVPGSGETAPAAAN